MIVNLVGKWLYQRENKNYFYINNTAALYGMPLFANLKKQNHEQTLGQLLHKRPCQNVFIYRIAYKISYGEKTWSISSDAVYRCIEKHGRDKYLSLFHPNENSV